MMNYKLSWTTLSMKNLKSDHFKYPLFNSHLFLYIANQLNFFDKKCLQNLKLSKNWNRIQNSRTLCLWCLVACETTHNKFRIIHFDYLYMRNWKKMLSNVIEWTKFDMMFSSRIQWFGGICLYYKCDCLHM